MKNTPSTGWQIWIDTGGTFTDCLGIDPAGKKTRIKVLSSSCLRGRITEKLSQNTYRFEAAWPYDGDLFKNYTFKLHGNDTPSRVVQIDRQRQTITLADDLSFTQPADFEITTGEEAPILAARLLTQTPLDQPLPPIAMRLGTTRGTNALLERKGAKTLLVVTKGFKDLLYIGNQQRPSLFQLNIPEPKLLYSEILEVDERLDAVGNVIQALDLADFNTKQRPTDYKSVALSLLHSYQNPEHESQLATWFRNIGAKYISASSDLFPFSHYLRRTQTAVVNAYLDPILDQYLTNIRAALTGGSLQVMTSTGSLSEVGGFRAKDSLLSGPAGGMVAATNFAQKMGFSKAITFDMGGTSTDTALIDGQPELKYITEIDGIEFHNPTLAIETVAAGGGSVCWFDGFSLQVGPESAGASPGPACYGAGGPLTVTDMNLLLGKLETSKFSIPINAEAAIARLEELRAYIQSQTGNLLSHQEILIGLERIANEKMADAIRKISVEKGINPNAFALVTFGGAGGLHACQLAELLGMNTVLLPYDGGLFSAAGIGEALISTIVSKQILLPWTEAAQNVTEWQGVLGNQAAGILQNQGIEAFEIVFYHVYLRFAGQENTVEIPYSGDTTLAVFEETYRTQFGYYPANAIVELESIKLKVQERGPGINPLQLIENGPKAQYLGNSKPFLTDLKRPEITVFEWDNLQPGDQLDGPSILLNNTSTTYLPEGWKLVIQHGLDAVAWKTEVAQTRAEKQSEEVALQLFTNRFKAVADEMGVQLQRTAFSVNVKERLDFSCALLDADGELLVNAQHIPVHLGSMGICGRLVREAIAIGPGDVVITNHPQYGGSHLPDITLIAGVFTEDETCVGYVINRAHHAEVGGKTPGSMPPDATCLAEEGVVIMPQYLVKAGEFQWEALRELFTSGPYPTRSFLSNEADIIAALSALKKGSAQLLKLVENHGLETVRKYMGMLKQTAVSQLRNALQPLQGQAFEASELLDDNHRIAVKISVADHKQIFDFVGTSDVHPNNLNANISILYSAILYVLRLLVNKEIPLNDGLMQDVEIKLPENSFLHPQFSDDPWQCPAVVGGNTEVSQRLVDTLLKAFGLAACSQGTMNNFLFGNEQFGYYETIGGGVGAGDGFHGRSAVHQHMTNTRITDPEQLERKYPVRLLEFGVRRGSGGAGCWRGGDGIVRKLEFLAPLQVTLLGQHRRYAPYGMAGGGDGLCGRHTLLSNGLSSQLPGICSLKVNAGDVLTIETPGGGAYGV
ncbi:5-oxoprolinase (ATP-hydrolyzing) [Dyadobacter sp. BE34]|uniref:5-oxoprolinase (ATP-hydrolyzing) n=1 Tax=Dyadobacter fermentans TaxID=94254 RepID=A0ABU1QQ04_9BACT|nr:MULTISPECIES: hydantoinase B/oxoprolinase family protein [Dyadobacter]MDR6803234.1 5-oxoprolinase (ATP-hydrolyzing) [Dyadobacter fermentans]MDR7040975.1 5-oxoprolinase (ATP-hydrolyzing) [Dyadobacter sp. BE242]MDR7195378.1 5-oxoprolinase (ATP-hydrolyzing) [Dyadobacter sp. BE34]MDR7214077.1 5-oxoprolinase (ATP-hydrolyzing) [Dyadobacter sp. BE31]MDR7260785.1 5-oxoprolinase (ATP-hydrolyzing) [Dyadobacter sp. BE32]